MEGLWKRAVRARANLSTQLGLTGASLPTEGVDEIEVVAPRGVWLGRLSLASEWGAAVLLLAVLIQLSRDNWWVPPRFRLDQPRALAPLVQYPRLLQGWSMFAPDAPRTDGTLVVDAVTQDGRHLDPFTGQTPDFEAPFHGPWYMGQLRCDYWLKIHFDGNAGYRDELRKYLERWQAIEGRPPQDRLVSFTVYWVENDAPPPGSVMPTNVRKTALVSGGAQARVSAIDAGPRAH
jgi:hypothetical protein